MLRFLGYLLIFVIGGAVGFFFGGGLGGGLGAIGGTCKVVNAAVASGAMTQDEANASVKSAFTEMATEMKTSEADLKKGLPTILEQMKKAHGGETTACQTALSAL